MLKTRCAPRETARMAKDRKIKLGIIFGGRSGEHEVSITSAASVINALDPEEFEITVIGITKTGKLARCFRNAHHAAARMCSPAFISVRHLEANNSECE